ncbi:MAG: phage baseplate assembly protein V [Burkholderia gladioli]
MGAGVEQARANEAQRVQRNSVFRGRVTAVDIGAQRCRVAIGDPETDGQGLESDWLLWATARAGTMRTWSAPTVGEQVKVECPMGDLAQGIVSGALYADDNPAPSASANEHLMLFGDGARIAYDDGGHALTVDLPAGATIRFAAPASVLVQTESATVKASTITLDAQQTACKGALTVEGPLSFLSGATGQGGEGSVMKINGSANFTGDVQAGGKSLIHHTHRAQGESAETSPPL